MCQWHYPMTTSLRGSHGLSARRARRTKSRGPEGLQLEVGARRAPKLLVYIYLSMSYMASSWTAIAILLLPLKCIPLTQLKDETNLFLQPCLSQTCPVGPDCSNLNKDLTSTLYGRRIIELQGVVNIFVASTFWPLENKNCGKAGFRGVLWLF